MPREDQERFEDYLELERYIDGLQEGRRVHPPQNLTAEQARIYQMAALFHSASPGTAEPRPEFMQSLQQRLLGEIEKHETGAASEEQDEGDQEPHDAPQLVQTQPPTPPAPRRVQANPLRRRLITGSAIAAASLAIGAGLGAAFKTEENSQTSGATPTGTLPPLVPNGPNNVTDWHYVTTVEQLGQNAVQFTTAGVIGFVIFNDKEQIIAFSAACTHMGCIVQWKADERLFRCPCHSGAFQENGKPVNKEPQRYLASLPRLKVRVESGKIYVEVPAIKEQAY